MGISPLAYCFYKDLGKMNVLT